MPRGRFSQDQIDEWVTRRSPVIHCGLSQPTTASPASTFRRSPTSRRSRMGRRTSGRSRRSSISMQSMAIRINTWLQTQTTVTITEVRDRFELTNHQWNQIWKKLDNKRIRDIARAISQGHLPKGSRHSAGDQARVQAAGQQPLSSLRTNSIGTRSPNRACRRFTTGTARGGPVPGPKVPCGGTRHAITKASPPASWSIWTDDEILIWVREKILEQSGAGTATVLQPVQRVAAQSASRAVRFTQFKFVCGRSATWGDIINEVTRRANERVAEDLVPA